MFDAPQRERAARLDALLADPNRVDAHVPDGPDDAERFFDDTLASGHEGIVAKCRNAPYEAGRRGATWRKVKPAHTLDLVVLAAEWGSGRREGWLSNLWLGARDGDDGFVMLGKTFKGLTDALLTWQTEQLLARELRRDGHVVTCDPSSSSRSRSTGYSAATTRAVSRCALRGSRVTGKTSRRTPPTRSRPCSSSRTGRGCSVSAQRAASRSHSMSDSISSVMSPVGIRP